jgi:hypothetical protein
VSRIHVAPRRDKNYEKIDQHLKARIPVKAGPHQLGVTFVKNPSSLLETKRSPTPPVSTCTGIRVSGGGLSGVDQRSLRPKRSGDTPSRRNIFVAEPSKPEEEDACAKQILSTLIRRAYRRPVTDADLQKPLAFYRKARAEDGFDAGIESALSAI